MADNVNITPGSGAAIRAVQKSSVDSQVVILDIGGGGAELLLVGDATYGIPVDVKRLAGSLTVVSAVAANLKVDASGATVPVSAASALPVSAPQGAPAFVRLSDGTNPITTLPVSGTVTGAQGTAAANAGAWPVKISDGTSSAGISDVSGAKAIKVDVVQSVALAGGLTDSGAFTAGASGISAIGGVYNDSVAAPSSGQAAALRINAARGLHVNLRKADGTDFATSGAPLRTDPTGTTSQPVKLSDDSGVAFSDANPLAVEISPNNRTRVSNTVSMTASQTAAAVWTPSANYFYITKIVLSITVAGTLTLFSGTNSNHNIVFDGTQATGNREYNFASAPLRASSASDVLKYTSGTGLTGVITVHGFEAAA